MKKETKKKISEWGSIIGLVSLLIGIYGVLSLNTWALYGGAVLSGIGFSFGIFVNPSMDEPLHVKIDR